MGTNGCPQEALAARQRQSRQAMPAAPGMPGAAPSDPGHGGEGAGDSLRRYHAHVPVAREWGAGRSSGAGPCIASRPDPAAGINGDTVRAPAADAGRRQARAAEGDLARVPEAAAECRAPRATARVPAGYASAAPGDGGCPAGAPAQHVGRSPSRPSRYRPGSSRPAPGCSLMPMSGLEIPVVCGRRSRGAALRGTDRP